jgi:glyoxylate carboligase
VKKWREAHKEESRASVNKWVAAHPEQKRAMGRRSWMKRRALKANAFVEAVDPLVVYERDRGVCGICLTQIAAGQKWHIDHIEPLSKGGAHSYDNTQLAHAFCNVSKGAKVPCGQGLLLRRVG